MRVTNNMINMNSMTNMNNNKVLVDALNTQMTTQKKINRPSEDPVIAIRALRLRSNLSEVNQFYEKNIPDAESWLDLTETALNNMKTTVTDIYKQCVNGSTDTLNQDDRNALLQNIQALQSQIYSEGNADNAGRTIFTGYKTGSQLTFGEAELNTTYHITEPLSYEQIQEKNYYSNQVVVPVDSTGVMSGVNQGDLPQEITNLRVRLSYDGITGGTGERDNITLSMQDESGKTVPLAYTDASGASRQVTATTISYEDWTEAGYAIGDNETLFIPETGELIFGRNVAEGIRGDKLSFSASYTKTGFDQGELRPEHYFDCSNITDPADVIDYTKEDQQIAYTVAYNQTIVVNTQASDVFDASIGRDVVELTDAVKAAIAAHDKVAKLENMKTQEQYADPDSQEMLDQWLEAAEREASYMDDNMQKLFSGAITSFQGYLDDISLAVTDVGSKGDQLKLTKNRMSNQQAAFEKLKSNNEDRELSDIIVDYTSAYTAYQASLMASSRVNQQTLLNYL